MVTVVMVILSSRKRNARQFSSLGDHHDDITESTSSHIDFDSMPPVQVQSQPDPHYNTSSGSSHKPYKQYSMSELDSMEFEEDDILEAIADV